MLEINEFILAEMCQMTFLPLITLPAHYTREMLLLSPLPPPHLVKGECELIEIISMCAVVQILPQGVSPGSMGIWRAGGAGRGGIGGVLWSQVTTTSAVLCQTTVGAP